jgi:rRNA maturation endonuclease Nob1
MTAPDQNAIIRAATAAGAFDPDDIQLYIGPGDGTAAERVAALKTAKPHLFRKTAKEMTDAEAKAALAEIHQSNKRADEAAAQTRAMKRVSEKLKL